MDISEFKKKDTPFAFQRHPWEIARGTIILDLVRHAKKDPVIHIVDFGCGDGYIASLFTGKELTRHYSAIDSALDGELMAHLAKEYRKVRFFSHLREVDGSLPAADIILILDVMEHVADEKLLLDEIKKYVGTTPDTAWIITVPAFRSVFSRHDTLLGHYRRYTVRQLAEVCQQNNLAIERKGYFFFSLLVARAFGKCIQGPLRREEDATAIPNWKGSRFLTAVYTRFLKIDYKIGVLISKLGIGLPGLSCYCVCRQLR
jgi:hypothetical protein